MNICTNHRTNFSLLTIVAVLLLSFVMSQDAYGQRRRHTRRPRTAISQKKTQRDTIPSVTTVINNIEGLYDTRTLTNLWDGSYTQITDTISKYFAGLPQAFKKESITKHYYDAIVDASEQDGQDLALLRNGIIQIALGEPTEMETAYTAVAMYYANANDKDNLSRILKFFDEYSQQHGNAYKHVIEQLNKEYDEILHPVPFTEKVKGTWAMVNHTGDMGFPYSIITITNLKQQRGGISMINFPGRDNATSDKKVVSLKNSQMIEGEDGHITAAFGSGHIKEGGSGFAQGGYEMTRQIRADMAGEIASSEGSLGEKVLQSIVTEGVSSILDGLFSLTVSSGYQRNAVLNMELHQTSFSNVLQGSIQYWDYKRPGDQPNFRTPPPIYNGYANYVRWEPEDGVFFVNHKGKVYSVTQTSELDLTEYKKIKKKYALTQPRYILPIIAGEIAGASLMGWGISRMVKEIRNSKDEDFGKIRGKDILTCAMVSTGLILSIAIPVEINNSRKRNREWAFRELNGKNLTKLRNKATMSVSIAPAINIDNTYGLSANIQF